MRRCPEIREGWWRKREAYDCWNWNVFRYWDYYILWIILELLYYDGYWNWNYEYCIILWILCRDVYIFLIFELYIYIVNYSFNYGRYVTYRTYVLSFFIIIITTIWIGRLFIFFKLFFHLVSISIYSSIVLFFYFLKNHSTLSFKYASISRNHVTLSQFRFI